MQALARRIVTGILARADVRIGGDRPWDLTVHNDRFYARALRGSLGVGESYIARGYYETSGSGLRKSWPCN